MSSVNDKPTKTLDEYQEERLAFWNSGKPFKGERIGVKCPQAKCSGQLLFKNAAVLHSYPPTRYAHCSKCSFSTKVYL